MKQGLREMMMALAAEQLICFGSVTSSFVLAGDRTALTVVKTGRLRD